MKNFFLALLCVFCFTVSLDAQKNSVRKMYEKAVSEIPAWQKGETKQEYAERYKNEKNRLYHKHFHRMNFNPSRYTSLYSIPRPVDTGCEFCVSEYNEAVYYVEEKERQERIRKERLDSIEREKQIANDILKAKRDSMILSEKNKADSLIELFFTNTYKNNKMGEVKKHRPELNSFIREYENIKKKRTVKIDALEKQYAGRLDGEIFKGKRYEINLLIFGELGTLHSKIEKTVESIEKVKSEVILDFQKFLEENGVNVDLLPNNYFSRIKFKTIEKEIDEFSELGYSVKKSSDKFYEETRSDYKYWILNN